jgi:hypothetical protein
MFKLGQFKFELGPSVLEREHASARRARTATRHFGVRGPRCLPDGRTPETDAIMWLPAPRATWGHAPPMRPHPPAPGYRRIKDVSTYDPQAYVPTPFSPRDSQGSYQSAEQEDYKRLIYLYSLATQTLTMIKLEND